MRYLSRFLTLVLFVALVASCSDQILEPSESDLSARLARNPQLNAVPFEADFGAEVTATKKADAGATLSAITTDCAFTTKGSKMTLDADCTTDGTLFILDGKTLDGRGRTITAVDPSGGHFLGAVVMNEGTTAHVRNLTVTTSGLANVCDGGADRLRGIMFEGASGSIKMNKVIGINQGASGCQEGNAIEVRNAPFDGTHPATITVEVTHNTIDDYQKTGIVANGDVDVTISHNNLSASATQANLAANTIQLGFGALGTAELNNLEGNQWKGTSNFAASGILVFAADPVTVSDNHITGNSDVGLFVISDDGLYEKNQVTDEGADHVNSCCDLGIGGFGVGNTFNKNHVKGFDEPFDPDPLPGSKNKAL